MEPARGKGKRREPEKGRGKESNPSEEGKGEETAGGEGMALSGTDAGVAAPVEDMAGRRIRVRALPRGKDRAPARRVVMEAAKTGLD